MQIFEFMGVFMFVALSRKTTERIHTKLGTQIIYNHDYVNVGSFLNCRGRSPAQ